MKIGKVEIDSNVFLAPMAGVTDIGFRFLAKTYGAGLTYTEMISAKGLLYKSDKTKIMLETADNEKPVVVQLFGKSPQDLADACKHPLINEFDIIDINMGCPAPKIVKNGEGSALLKNPQLAKQIIEACVKATDKPITVKFRIGFDDGDNVAVEFAKMCESAGASAICVHGRTRSQMYSGKVDYETIKAVKQAVNIPVIGNGDVVDKKTYDKMAETGVDAVMVGRGSLGSPWIFQKLKNKNFVPNVLKDIETHVSMLKQNHTDNWTNKYMRKHLLWYLKAEKISAEKRIAIVSAKTTEEAMKIVGNCFKD